MNVPILLVLALGVAVRAGAVDGQAPPLRYTVSPLPLKGGVEAVISIPAFGSKRMFCSAFLPGPSAETDEAPCGTQAAALRISPTALSIGKVLLTIEACTSSRRVESGNECWSYGGDVDSGFRPLSAGAAGARAPGAAAPTPGGLADSAPPLLRSAAPAAPAPDAPPAQGRHWKAEAQPGAAPKPAKREFRGHDGRVYVREDPAAGSLADKDERYRKALAADPAVRAAYENWRDLDDAGRRDALQRMSDIQAETYGVAPSKVVLHHGGQPGELAHYSSSDNNLTMNTASPYYNSPSMEINAVSHEARHRWQHSLVDQLRTPGFAGEERALGEAFKVSFDHYCSPGGARGCDYATYRNQLVERDAFEQGEAAALYLRQQRQ